MNLVSYKRSVTAAISTLPSSSCFSHLPKVRQLARISRPMLPAQVSARAEQGWTGCPLFPRRIITSWSPTMWLANSEFLLFLLILTKTYEWSIILLFDRWRNWISVSSYDLPRSHACRWLRWNSKLSLLCSRFHILLRCGTFFQGTIGGITLVCPS